MISLPKFTALPIAPGRSNSGSVERQHYILFETETGKQILGDKTALTARQIFKVKADRDSIFKDGKHFANPPKRYPSFGGREFKPWVYGCVQIYFPNHKTESLHMPAHSAIYHFSKEQDSRMRNRLDSLASTTYDYDLQKFVNSYQVGKDSNEISDVRYALPMAISPDEQRVVIAGPYTCWTCSNCEDQFEWENTIHGLYPHNGACFFRVELSYKVNTLYFTEDDQYLVVNHGEETEQYFYLPSLPQLVDTCRNMFFRWKMSDEERYQTLWYK